MKLRKFRLKTCGVFWFLSSVLLVGSSPAFAGDMCQVIRIMKGTGGAVTRVELFPEKVTVPVGTCTVWMNWVDKGEVQVSFRENAKQCMLSSESPSGFREGELKPGESCYLTDALPRGKTASLYWNSPGSYKYTVELVDDGRVKMYPGKKIAEGIIEVK